VKLGESGGKTKKGSISLKNTDLSTVTGTNAIIYTETLEQMSGL
jgi:hypothetical protein